MTSSHVYLFHFCVLSLVVSLCVVSCHPPPPASASASPFTPQDYMQSLNKEWLSVCTSDHSPHAPKLQYTHENMQAKHTPSASSQVGEYSIVSGYHSDCIASAWYNDSQSQVGWGYLHLETNSQYDADVQLYGAGLLESYLTHTRIWQSKQNLWKDYFIPHDGPANRTLQYIEEMIQYNLKMVADRASYDQFWLHVGYTYNQLQGLIDGYQSFCNSSESLSWMDLYILNLIGDYGDLDRTARPNATNHAKSRLFAQDDDDDAESRAHIDHCSALIKLTPNNSSIYFGHGTWDGFSNMLRIFKYYSFALPNVANQITHFSSYPAVLDSYDDFYVLQDSMMSVTETTNTIYNMSLYDGNTPYSVPTWIRVIVANRLANSGPQWNEYFAQFNSGSYNSQWMVLDYKLFTPHQPLLPNTLWVVSPMPAYVAAGDMTHILAQQTYWASYNIPRDAELYEAMGFAAQLAEYGPWEWSYNASYRASIFARQQSSIEDMTDMQQTLTWNHFKTDPISRGDAGHAIQARYDLTKRAHTSGGIDCKITSSDWMFEGIGRVVAHSGPTHFWPDTPPFDWSVWPDPPNMGMPTVYNFMFQEFYNNDNNMIEKNKPTTAPDDDSVMIEQK